MDISAKRQEIVDQAYRAFYDGGFHATGIDAVMAGSGISKRTLYKYFPSKEDLIQAVLEKYAGEAGDALMTAALARSEDPRRQIEAIFDIRREAMLTGDFRGCLAQKAAQEYKGKHDGIETCVRAGQGMLEDQLAALCEKAGLADPMGKAQQINVLLQGAVLLAQMRRDGTPFDAAKAMLKSILTQ